MTDHNEYAGILRSKIPVATGPVVTLIERPDFKVNKYVQVVKPPDDAYIGSRQEAVDAANGERWATWTERTNEDGSISLEDIQGDISVGADAGSDGVAASSFVMIRRPDKVLTNEPGGPAVTVWPSGRVEVSDGVPEPLIIEPK